MARPLRIDYPGAIYHITCRGNERRAIFGDDADRRAFQKRLATCVATYQLRLHGYVLMDPEKGTGYFSMLFIKSKA